MNITVLQENLSKSLNLLSKVLPSKTTTIGALQSFLIKAQDGTITATASDLEKTLIVPIPGKIQEEGSLLLPGKTTLSLLSSLSEGKTTIKSKDKQLVIESGSSRVVLSTEEVDHFPKTNQGEVSWEEWKDGPHFISEVGKKVLFACSSDQARAVLTGVLVFGEKEGSIAAATDGFRLSYFKKSDGIVALPKIIIPSNVISLLLLLLKESEDKKISYYYDKQESTVFFSVGEVLFSTRLIEGTFPDFQKIIPKDAATTIVVPREEFLKAVRLSSVLAREAANIIRLSFSKDTLIVSAQAPQAGENKTTIPVAKKGEDVETAFNFRFLLDILNADESEDITFETNGPLSPGVFRFPQNKDYLHVIMPVRLQGE